MNRMDEFLLKILEHGASDLHLTSTFRPFMRLNGDMQTLDQYPVLTPEMNRELIYEILPAKNREEFEASWDTDFAYALGNNVRFRANVFMDYFGIGAVLRLIPSRIPTLDELGLPKVLRDFCFLSKGMVVVTGPTGSGKSTTLAAMINFINQNRTEHIITIEDPIEFLHSSKRCLINQREVHAHTKSFANALRAALREDPDIVLVGEMRDLVTMEIAIETAETGHLVFATLHTNSAATTVDRMIDKFPSGQQNQIRVMLADVLKGVVAQTLCRKRGGGRVAAFEVLVANHAIAANIRDGKTHQIPSAMQIGKGQGMQLLNDALLGLVNDGLITTREAYIRAVDKDQLLLKFHESGLPFDLGMAEAEMVAAQMESSWEPIPPANLEALMQEWRAQLRENGDQVDILNNVAWVLATSTQDSLRNGREAVRLAERAAHLTKEKDPRILDTLAAAHAEAGSYDRAVLTVRRALDLAAIAGQEQMIKSMQQQVEQYSQGQPWRE